MGRGGEFWRSDVAEVPALSVHCITDRRSIRASAPMLEAAECFRGAPELRVLAVVDAMGRPVGAIHERDIRALLFSPFGYALLTNRSLAIGLDRHIRSCPAIELGAPLSTVFDALLGRNDGEGLIATRGGRFEGMIDQAMLLMLAGQRDAAITAARAVRADAIDAASLRFEAGAHELSAELAAASSLVAETSVRMADRADAIGARTAAVAAATTQAAINMNEIAGQGETLATTLDAVEARMSEAQAATRGAVERVASGRRQVDSLGTAADKIGDVTSLIDEIAQRTTMLALNATIEAARAGDAGHGFAVVAGEVKALAGQTRRAAAGITAHIDRIRGAIGEVTAGHDGMTGAVGAIDTLSATIVDAMRVQGIATRDISANVQDASRATEHVSANVQDMLGGATEAGCDAIEMRDLARTLVARAGTLDRHLARFLKEVQTA